MPTLIVDVAHAVTARSEAVPSFWERLFGAYDPPDVGVIGDPLMPFGADTSLTVPTPDIWTLPTVVAARQLCANTTAVMRLVALNDHERVDPTPSLLRRPDPAERYRVTLERIVNAMTRHGTAWLVVIARASNGYPLAVRVVDNRRINYQVTSAGDRLERVTVDGVDVPLSEIVTIPMTVDDSPVGTSPLATIRPQLEQIAEVYAFAANYYRMAAVPPYAVRHPNRLTAAQARALSDQWLTARLERRPPVLSGGVEIETYSSTGAAESAMTDAVDYLDNLIGRALMIPPSLLNMAARSSLTYATSLDERFRFLQLGLAPMFLTRIEAAFTDMLPRGTTAQFDTSSLLRMDFAGRIATYTDSIGAGIHTVQEVRALEGLPNPPSPDPVPVEQNVEGL